MMAAPCRCPTGISPSSTGTGYHAIMQSDDIAITGKYAVFANQTI